MVHQYGGQNFFRKSGYVTENTVSARDFIKMKKAKEKLPSALKITKDDKELIELSRESSRISEDLIMDMKDIQAQTDNSFTDARAARSG